MNEELYLIIKAFYSIGVDLGESKGSISKKGNKLINDYKQIGIHEEKWIFSDDDSSIEDDENKKGVGQLEYPNEESCYLRLDILDDLAEIFNIAQSQAKAMKRDMKDKKSKEIITKYLYEIAIESADELNGNLLDSTFDLNEENVLRAIEGKTSITEIRAIIEAIYVEHVVVQAHTYIDEKIGFITNLKENNYTKAMLKLLKKEAKAIEKAKELLQLVIIREKFELEVIKLFACYNIDAIIEYQRLTLTRSQVRKLATYAKTIKKDINGKETNSRQLITKIHNSMHRKNYK